MTSTIEALHAAWTRAGDILTANDRAIHEAGEDASPALTNAQKVLDRQMIDLSLVILREMPGTIADVLILAKHLSNAADLVAHSDPVADGAAMDALNVGTENLLAFLVGRFGGEAPMVDAKFEIDRASARTNATREA